MGGAAVRDNINDNKVHLVNRREDGSDVSACEEVAVTSQFTRTIGGAI